MGKKWISIALYLSDFPVLKRMIYVGYVCLGVGTSICVCVCVCSL